MTEVLTLAKERIKAIDFEIAALANEQQELETFIRVYDSLAAPEKAQPVAPAGEGAHNPTSPAPNPVANVGEEANGTDAAASVDPASREADDADRQQLAASGLTGEAADASPKTHRDDADEPVREVSAAHSAAPAATPAKPTGPQAKHAAEASTEPMGAGGVQDRCESAPPPSTPDKSGEGADASSSAPSLASRLKALHAEHPEYTAAQAADALGETPHRVHSNSAVHKIKWAPGERGRPAAKVLEPDPVDEKLTRLHDEYPNWTSRMLAHRLGISAIRVAAKAKALGLELPETYEASAPSSASTGRTSPSAIVTKPIVRPKGTRFYLRNDDGEYLHFSCEQMTVTKAYAWIGNEQQLAAVRRRFPLAQDLREQVIEKEQARAA